jgi:branched-chain amino acid transport system substrate-binding protein
MMRLQSLGALLVAALLVTSTVIQARAAEPYDINVILSETGPFAFLGAEESTSLKALEVLENKHGGINGRPIHFVMQDDQSTPIVAVQLANAIIAQHVPVLLGSTSLASCLAIAPLVRQSGPLEYCYAPTLHPQPGSYVFSATASSRDLMRALLTYAEARGWNKVALISSTDATGQDHEAQFNAVMASGEFSRMTVVDREKFNPGDVSVAAQVERMKAAAPNVVILGTVGTPTGTALHAIHDAALDVPLMTNPGNLIRKQMAQYAAFLPAELYFATPRFVAQDVSRSGPVRDQQLAFSAAIHGQGSEPDMGYNFSWDATRVVIDALRHTGPNPDAKQVHDYIEALYSFVGSDGIMDYRGGDQRGVTLSSLVVARWDGAKQNWLTQSQPGGKPLH